jgi:hypothetical protein
MHRGPSWGRPKHSNTTTNQPPSSSKQNSPNQTAFNKTSTLTTETNPSRRNLVRSPRFEPGSSAWQADVLDQARLRPPWDGLRPFCLFSFPKERNVFWCCTGRGRSSQSWWICRAFDRAESCRSKCASASSCINVELVNNKV